MKIDIEKTGAQGDVFERIQFAELASIYWNRYYEDDGIILEFETDNSIHRIRLNRKVAAELARYLNDAENGWRCSRIKYNPVTIGYEDEPD